MIYAFEGIDGCGKSAAVHYVSELLLKQNRRVLCLTDWDALPRIKDMMIGLEDRTAQFMSVLLARSQILPVLKSLKNMTVLMDRHVLSTAVYQLAEYNAGKFSGFDKRYLPLLEKFASETVPVYIRPTEHYLREMREKFLSQREQKDRFDSFDPEKFRQAYDFVFGLENNLENGKAYRQYLRDSFPKTFRFFEGFVIENNGDSEFFEKLNKFSDRI